MSLAKKANQIEYEIIQSRGKKLFDQHGLEAGKVIRAMAVSKAKQSLAKEQPSEEQPSAEQPEEMNEDKLREMVKAALSKPLDEKKGKLKELSKSTYNSAAAQALSKGDENLALNFLSHSNQMGIPDKKNDRYMFFSNLEQMRRQCDILLDLDRSMVERILDDGHDWAQDHIAEAKSFLDQVFDFLMNETKKTEPSLSVAMDEAKKITAPQKKKRGEIYDALKDQGMSDEKAGRIATSKAMKKKIKEAILAKLKNK